MYDRYEIFLRETNKFSIAANDIFDEYKITDLIIDYRNYKKELLEIFSETDQIVNIINRIISYLEYNEMN